MKKQFDLIVVGAGSGGLAAAKRAASYGANVALIEGDRVGGTCVIRGCVPKKLLVYGSMYKKYFRDANSFGFYPKDVQFKVEELLENVRKEVDRLDQLHSQLLTRAGVHLIKGWASFASNKSVLIRQEENIQSTYEIKGEKILIAVGGRPNIPTFEGSSLGWVSDDIFLLKSLPEKIVIIGGGFIACEFASIFNGLGIKVSQLVRGRNLLKGFDRDLSKLLEDEMQEDGIDLKFATYPLSISGEPGALSIKTNSQESINCGGLLFAIGRKPFIEGLGLDNVGVKIFDNKILVDRSNRTNIENIYAIGDVTDRFNLTPIAVDEGRAFSDTFFGENAREVDYEFIPKAVFSKPEIASVGFSEQTAIEKYGENNIETFRSKFRPMSQALQKGKSNVLLKLVVHKNNRRVIGCHMVGENASEIIQMAAIGLSMGSTKEDFDRTMALHPTVAEEFVTMT